MTDDERTVIEWAIWNVRVCDLPADVRGAVERLDKTGLFPRPGRVGGYPLVDVHVHAFPRDETVPVRDRFATSGHVGGVVQDMAAPDVGYILIHFDHA